MYELFLSYIFKNIDIQASLINYPYCLVIVPLLIETKSVKYFDKVLLVDVLENIQFERVTKRDCISPALLGKIIKTQATRSERLKYADDIIENNNEIGNLNEYINYLNLINFVPYDICEIHYIDKVLIQIDILFIKKSILNEIFPGKKILNILN